MASSKLSGVPSDLVPANPYTEPQGSPPDLVPFNPEVSGGRATAMGAAQGILPAIAGAAAIPAAIAAAPFELTGLAALGATLGVGYAAGTAADYLQNKVLEAFPETAKSIGLGEK